MVQYQSGSQQEDFEVAEIVGVSPSVALAWRGRDDVVLIREDLDQGQVPAELRRLLRAPRCEERDTPIRLSSHLLGILGVDDETEVDLVQPYDLEIRADESSAPASEHASFSVLVPARLGRPLSRGALESLFTDATLSLTLSCEKDRYIVEELEAHPPS